MKVNRRTQAERSAATRDALIAAARKLFAQRGYASVGTPEIARNAGVTRGAMYYQFEDKSQLFAAVAEAVEADVTRGIVDDVTAHAAGDPLAALHRAVDAWLDACEEREARQVILLDAPVVLGWEGLRELAREYGLGLTEEMLSAAIEAGQLPNLPIGPLAHALIGSLQEAAFLIAAEPEAKPEAAEVLHAIIEGLAQSGPG